MDVLPVSRKHIESHRENVASSPVPTQEGSPVRAKPSLNPAARTSTRPIASTFIRPESIHPTLWLGHQLGRHAQTAVSTGYALLDAQLPGRGWPSRALTELLLPHPGVGEIRLLGPSLISTQKGGRLVMLFDPPELLSGSALERLGFNVEQLLIINTRTRLIPGSDSLWALEQALKSGHVGAVIAWLPPRLRAERLRRLQLAAHAHDGPAFVLRELSAAQRPTAAPLRLGLRASGADVLAVRVFKRRGPPLAAPVLLALPHVLSEVAQQRSNVAPGIKAGDLISTKIVQRDDAHAHVEFIDPEYVEAERSANIAATSYMKEAALRAATFINLDAD